MLTALVFAAIAPAAAPEIGDYVQRNLKDATFVARIVKGDQRELVKINRDFGQSYKFDATTIRFKEPFKIRLEAQVDDARVLYIINGTKMAYRVPSLRINGVQDLAKAPGRRQTPLDFGMLTPSLFGNFFDAKFVRNDRATGAVVFDLTYRKDLDDTSRHRIWVDPERRYTIRREWYNQYGRQLATFLYEAPKQEDGIWLPTRMTVKNVEDRVAGVTRYEAFKLNTGLGDDLFELR